MSPITFFAYKINAVLNVRIVKIYTMLVKLTANGLCMSSGTCTHFQISTKLSVPLLIHGVMCRFFIHEFNLEI
jgi:hypothetical protein